MKTKFIVLSVAIIICIFIYKDYSTIKKSSNYEVVVTNEYYEIVSDDLFKIYDIENNLEKSIKNFDFSYYNRILNSINEKVFYIVYNHNEQYFMRKYVLKNGMESYNLEIPDSSEYYLITDCVPSFTASLNDYEVIDHTDFKVIDTFYYKHKYSDSDGRTVGEDYNPMRIFMKFNLEGDEGYAIIENHAGISLNKYKVIFCKESN